MPKKVVPLTATQIKSAKSQDKEFSLTDGDGLHLRVRPNGSKVWIFKYYHPVTKKRTNMSFGSYPEVSLAKARQLRIDSREKLAEGISPKQHRDLENKTKKFTATNTLKKVTKEWIKVKATKVTEDHAHDIYRSLEKDIFPKLGEVPIGEILAPMAIETMKPISKRGNHESVKRLCQRLNEVMVYATNTGLIHHNPLAGIKEAFQTPSPVHLAALPPEELPEFMQALSKGGMRFLTRHLIHWQLHTMTRPGEAAGARWDEIDIVKAVWTIPAERMKRKRAHIIVLSKQCLTMLEEIRAVSGHREYLFPGNRSPKTSMSPASANMAIKKMGFAKRLVAHGLRTIASTILNEQNFDADLIETALSHVSSNDIRNIYNRAEYIDRRRVMMQWWSDHIDKASTQNKI